MLHYTHEQLATVIAIPIVTILLIWTVTIFHKNRKRWGPYDIPIVSVLCLSIIRNLTILAYTFVIIFNQGSFNLEYCSLVIWIFNSIHTFQASCLTTIAVIGLFSTKLHCKQQNLRQFLTATHVIYHLFCLTTLCACVGVAAILAQTDKSTVFQNVASFDVNPCKFMPFDLDIKFNVFIIVLHVFLGTISLVAFFMICVNYCKWKRNGFDYLKKSNSDLSDLSCGMTNTFGNDNKNYYDTYTLQRAKGMGDNNNYCDGQNGANFPGKEYHHGHKDLVWNSDMSNLSTTVSSTNSRRPCIAKNIQEEEHDNRTGLETIHPVLIVCYLFYHLPVIVLCIYPKLIAPWPVVGAALWLGLIQDLLIPIGLGIVDSRFCKWVSNVYRCSSTKIEEKLPHVGLDGKFRPFGNASQPQSLEILQNHHQDRNVRNFQAVEHRFPITNGSLYTSIDGRLPVIHNYRRHKEQRSGIKTEKQSSNVALHSNHLMRQDMPNKLASCRNCEVDLCPSHSNLHHLSPHYINKQLNFIQQNNNLIIGRGMVPNRISLSQESLQQQVLFHPEFNNHVMKNSRNLVRLNRMRLSKSDDGLNDIEKEAAQFQANPETFALANPQTTRFLGHQPGSSQDYQSSSEDEYITDINNSNDRNFDSLSSKSCYSITTEANGDFEFFQNQNTDKLETLPIQPTNDFYPLNPPRNILTTFQPTDSYQNSKATMDVNRNFRITRSNSKRSLENFQAFVEEREDEMASYSKLQRSNSYMTLEDRRRRKHGKKLLRSSSKLSDCTHNIRQKIKSVEYLPNSNASTVYIEDVCYLNMHNRKNGNTNSNKYVGSVPDFKKVFISEYI